MKIICTYSGIEFTVSHFQNSLSARFTVNGAHPIFNQPVKILLSRARDFQEGKLNEEECRLLFLALLNSTELVSFHVPATPSRKIVLANMEAMLRVTNWINAAKPLHIAWPRVSINHQTRYLEQIGGWLDAWLNAKQEASQSARYRNLIENIVKKEEILNRYIKSASKQLTSYSKLLGSWVMDATDAPADMRDYWISLFQLRGIDIYNAHTASLQELVDWMHENLPLNSLPAFTAFRHVNNILAKNSRGVFAALGTDSFTLLDDEDESEELDPVTGQKLVTSRNENAVSIEQFYRQQVIASAPLTEPKRVDYPDNVVGFLRAKAAWSIAQSEAAKYAAMLAETAVPANNPIAFAVDKVDEE